MGKVECFSCGKGFNGDTNALLMHFKRMYNEKGIVRYFFRLSENGNVLTCKGKDFKAIFEQQIKPNFANGAEYSHIAEYNPIA